MTSEFKDCKKFVVYYDALKINYSDPGDGNVKWDFPHAVFNSTVYNSMWHGFHLTDLT